MNKIRIRNETELSNRKKNFFKIVNILEEMNVNFFLQGGVLLGARREQNFIKWDWDIEIGLFNEELITKFDLLIKDLEEKNYTIQNHNKTSYTPKISFIDKKDDSTSYSLIGWKHNKVLKCFTRKHFMIPEKFLMEFDKIKFFGKEFNCPKPIDEYLKHHYGNWKTPLMSSNKQEYLNKNFYKNKENLFDIIYKIFDFIKKKF
tara:strand:- start:395 stop:1003 length:609 start_codon:yes stop_codon:yes gene_type:complete